MISRFRAYGAAFLLLVLLGGFFAAPGDVRGELLETLCASNEDPSSVMQSLIEEAEATGMPPSTLNRLLIRGYHDKKSIRILNRLLCLVVRAEENGLPPGLLFRKLDEGLGKRAPLERISQVVEAKIADMEYVQALLSDGKEPLLEDENVARLTHTLAAGLDRDELKAIFNLIYEVPVEMRVVAAEIKGYGRAMGFSDALLDQIVSVGLASRSLSDEWSYFISVAANARKQKISDQRITAQTLEVLRRHGTPDDLSISLGLN